MKTFLPTPEVQEEFISDLRSLIPRVLIDYLPAYKFLSNIVVHHIPHAHSMQMDKASKVVSEQLVQLDKMMVLFTS